MLAQLLHDWLEKQTSFRNSVTNKLSVHLEIKQVRNDLLIYRTLVCRWWPRQMQAGGFLKQNKIEEEGFPAYLLEKRLTSCRRNSGRTEEDDAVPTFSLLISYDGREKGQTQTIEQKLRIGSLTFSFIGLFLSDRCSLELAWMLSIAARLSIRPFSPKPPGFERLTRL